MLHPIYALKGSGLEAEYGAKWAKEGVEEFLVHYTDGERVYDDAIRAWAQVIYGNALDRSGKKYFLDKTPRYFFIIPELYRLFPKAKFIFLIRNPLAVLASELSTYVKGNWPILGLFQPDLLLAPHRLLEGIELLGRDAITVHYEKFVSTPEASISALCQYLGIAFHPEMLDYSRTPAPKGKMNDPVGVHQHVRPSTNSVDKWKQMANDAQTRHFASAYLHGLGQEVFERLGYSFDEISRVFPETMCNVDSGSNLFPWSIAIRPEKDWTFREWLAAERFFSMQQKGYLRAALSVTKRGVTHLLQRLKHELSRLEVPRAP